MKFALKSRDARLEARSDWHPWFAWRPIRVGDGDVRWLEVIERMVTGWSPLFVFYKYRAREK